MAPIVVDVATNFKNYRDTSGNPDALMLVCLESGISKMLLQSQNGEFQILPALPSP